MLSVNRPDTDVIPLTLAIGIYFGSFFSYSSRIYGKGFPRPLNLAWRYTRNEFFLVLGCHRFN